MIDGAALPAVWMVVAGVALLAVSVLFGLLGRRRPARAPAPAVPDADVVAGAVLEPAHQIRLDHAAEAFGEVDDALTPATDGPAPEDKLAELGKLRRGARVGQSYEDMKAMVKALEPKRKR
jgi:hypothetical protein